MMTLSKCFLAVGLVVFWAGSALAASVTLQKTAGAGAGVHTWDVVYDPAGTANVGSLQQKIKVSDLGGVTNGDAGVTGSDSGAPDWISFGIVGFADLPNGEILYGGLTFTEGGIATPAPVTLGTFSVDWDGATPVHVTNGFGEFKDGGGADVTNASAHILATLAVADPTSKDEAGCLNTMNKNGIKLASAWNKDATACVKNATKGKLEVSIDECLIADGKGKVAKGEGKVDSGESGKCGSPPSFGFAGSSAIKAGASASALALFQDLYGANPGALVVGPEDKAGGKCQTNVHKNAAKLYGTKMKEFVGCKKGALKAAPPDDLGALQAAIFACLAADAKGKIAGGVSKLSDKIKGSCSDAQISLFSGLLTLCGGSANLDEFVSCVDRAVECRFCEAIAAYDGLLLNCDVFDDGLNNNSCSF